MTVRQITGSHSTVIEVMRSAASVNPDIEAYVDGDLRMTFGQWDEAADGVAALLAEHGVGRGSVACLLLPSSIGYAVCYQAAMRLGAVTSGINVRLGPSERASITARTRPAVTVYDPALFSPDDLPGDAGVLLECGTLVDAFSRPAPVLPRLEPDDPVAIVWTSGSTGFPKGAVFDHRNLAAVAAGTDVLSHPGDRRLSPLPFAHVGYMTRAWDEIAHAVTTVVTPTPWSAASTIELIERERVTVGQGVPTQWSLVMAHPSLPEADLSSLRIAGIGAARVPAELVREMRRTLGCPVVVRYTSTESSLGTGTRPDDPDEVVATTVGRPVAGVELEIVADDGRPAGTGQVGRVRLRSGAVMRGYLAAAGADVDVDGEVEGGVAGSPPGLALDRAATSAVIDESGWLITGDMGWMGDDGNLRLVGRSGEMYIRGGYNVYPAEVEEVLSQHPALAEAAVVGVDDPVLGEVGVAFVVAASGPGSVPGLDELREWCSAHLADYKAPDRLRLVEALPLTPMSKVDKVELRAWAAQPTEGRP